MMEDTLQTLDLLGLRCPVPVLKANEEINRLAPGQTIELIADDPACLRDIPAWVKHSGHKLLKFCKDGDRLQFLIQKEGGE